MANECADEKRDSESPNEQKQEMQTV